MLLFSQALAEAPGGNAKAEELRQIERHKERRRKKAAAELEEWTSYLQQVAEAEEQAQQAQECADKAAADRKAADAKARVELGRGVIKKY